MSADGTNQESLSFPRIFDFFSLWRPLSVTAHGTGMEGRCPLCIEGHMSFNAEDSTYRCDSCEASGNVFNFLERLVGSSSRAAILVSQLLPR